MDQTSEAVLALKPVTFEYKSDTNGRPQFGLIAEEVAEVNQDLVIRDKKGEAYTVRYDAVNAMLLNEFLKEHRKVEQLETTVASLAAAVKEQAVQLQRVSAENGINKPAAKVASTIRKDFAARNLKRANALALRQKGAMNITKNLGMLLLAIYLILVGLTALLHFAFPGIVMAILALAAGILILIGK
jgi:hypothetical protein